MSQQEIGRLDIIIQAKYEEALRKIDEAKRALGQTERAGRGAEKGASAAAKGMRNAGGAADDMSRRVSRGSKRATQGMSTLARTARRLVAAFLALRAVQAVTQYLRDSVSAAEDLQRAMLKVESASRLFDVSQEMMSENVQRARRELQLSAGQAAELTVQTTKLAARAGQASESWNLMASALDLGAAQGYSATEVAVALEQTLRGLDEGTDKLLQKNPSQVYEDYARSIGTTVGRLTDVEQKQALVTAITDEAAKVQGAYGEMLESDIGRLGRYRTRMTEVRQTIGTALLPAVADVADILGEEATDGAEHFANRLKSVGDWVRDNREDIRDFIGDLGEVVDALTTITTMVAKPVVFTVEVAGDVAGFGSRWFNTFIENLRQNLESEGHHAYRVLKDEHASTIYAALEEAKAEMRSIRERFPTMALMGDTEDVVALQEKIDYLQVALADAYERTEWRPNQRPSRPGVDGDGENDPEVDEDAVKRAQKAREELERMATELQRVQDLGYDSIDAAPERLRDLVGEIVALDAQIDETESAVAESEAPAPPQVEAYLDHLKDLRDIRAGLLNDMKADPDLLRPEEAAQATEELEKTTRQFAMLREMGLDALKDLPEPLREAITEVGRLNDEITSLEDLIRRAGDSAPESAHAMLAALKAQRDAAMETASELRTYKDVIDRLPEGITAMVEAMDAEGLNEARAEVEALAEAAQELEAARNGVKLAELSGDTDRLRVATERLSRAQDSAQRKLAALEGVLGRLGVGGDTVSSILAQVAEDLDLTAENAEGAADGLAKIAETTRDMAALADGVLSVVDALGLVDDETAKALEGVVDFAQGAATAMAGIASGNPLATVGGVVQAIGGAAKAIGGLFGESEADKERKRVMRDNTRALERLRDGVAELGAVLSSGVTGKTLTDLEGVIAAFSEARRSNDGIWGIVEGSQVLERGMARIGMSFEEAQEIAAGFGIELDNSVESWEAFLEALRGFELDQLFESFQGQMSMLRREFEMFDITDPTEQLKRTLEIFLEFANLDPGGSLSRLIRELMGITGMEEQIESLDLSTVEGRAELEAIIQELFIAAQSGTLDPSQLGGLTVEEFLTMLSDLEGLIDAAEEGGASGRSRNVQQVTSISAIQANQLLAYQSTQTRIQQQILDLLNGQVSIPAVSPTQVIARSSLSFGDVNLRLNLPDGATPGQAEAMGAAAGRGLLRQVREEMQSEARRQGAQPGTKKTLEITV